MAKEANKYPTTILVISILEKIMSQTNQQAGPHGISTKEEDFSICVW